MGTFFCENMFFVQINFVTQISKWHTSAFPFFEENNFPQKKISGDIFSYSGFLHCEDGDGGVGREVGRFIDIYNCPAIL